MKAAGQPFLAAFMSLSRPKLTLDEQSFQDMLAAAFTIQEHNARRKAALQPSPTCGKCGEAVSVGESLCAACAALEVRPGEKLQRNWASLWLMGQERGLWPEPESQEQADAYVEKKSSNLSTASEQRPPESPQDPVTIRIQEAVADSEESLILELEPHELIPAGPADLSPVEDAEEELPAPPPGSLRDLRLRLRFHRADLYLFVAIVVSTLAMLWVLLATPQTSAQQKPRLRPWERALVSLGLAEAPDAPARRGNPSAQVWVDPKTALYYCYGEEQFGKTPGGHAASQREAQLDSFEPAGRVACD